VANQPCGPPTAVELSVPVKDAPLALPLGTIAIAQAGGPRADSNPPKTHQEEASANTFFLNVIANLQKDLAAAKAQIEGLARDKKTLEGLLKLEEAQLGALSKDRARHEAEIERLVKDNKDKDGQIKAQAADIEALRQHKARAEANLTVYRAEVERRGDLLRQAQDRWKHEEALRLSQAADHAREKQIWAQELAQANARIKQAAQQLAEANYDAHESARKAIEAQTRAEQAERQKAALEDREKQRLEGLAREKAEMEKRRASAEAQIACNEQRQRVFVHYFSLFPAVGPALPREQFLATLAREIEPGMSPLKQDVAAMDLMAFLDRIALVQQVPAKYCAQRERVDFWIPERFLDAIMATFMGPDMPLEKLRQGVATVIGMIESLAKNDSERARWAFTEQNNFRQRAAERQQRRLAGLGPLDEAELVELNKQIDANRELTGAEAAEQKRALILSKQSGDKERKG
jgi:hypothetical protein